MNRWKGIWEIGQWERPELEKIHAELRGILGDANCVSRVDAPQALDALEVLRGRFLGFTCLLHRVPLNTESAAGLLRFLMKGYHRSCISEDEVNWNILALDMLDDYEASNDMVKARLKDMESELKRAVVLDESRILDKLRCHFPYVPQLGCRLVWSEAQGVLRYMELSSYHADQELSGRIDWGPIARRWYALHHYAKAPPSSMKLYHYALWYLENCYPWSFPSGYKSDSYVPDILVELRRHFFGAESPYWRGYKSNDEVMAGLQQTCPDSFPSEGEIDWRKIVRELNIQHIELEQAKFLKGSFPDDVQEDGKVDWEAIGQTLEVMGAL